MSNYLSVIYICGSVVLEKQWPWPATNNNYIATCVDFSLKSMQNQSTEYAQLMQFIAKHACIASSMSLAV